MFQNIQRSIHEPIRKGLSYDERWASNDKGLIISWEVGRELKEKKPELAEKAKNDELPVLGWKGGVEKITIKKEKYGCFYYFAQWQGLRGDNLNIDTSYDKELVCSKTGIKVTYTSDSKKYVTA